MLILGSIVLLATAAQVCSGHRVCKPGIVCATTAAPVCKATPKPLKLRPTFPCLEYGYVSLNDVVYGVDLETGKSRKFGTITTPDAKFEVNAIGHNPKDNYLYGTQKRRLLRILADGTTEDVLHRDLPMPKRPNLGDFDEHGTYWISYRGENWASVDLDPRSKTYRRVETGVSSFSDSEPSAKWPRAADWAYTPVDPGHLYGIGVSHDRQKPVLVRWSVATKKWEIVYEAKHLSGSRAFGAVMSTRDGIIYGLENKFGTIVRFDLYNHSRTSEIAGGPVSTSHLKRTDGTRCLMRRDDDRGSKLI